MDSQTSEAFSRLFKEAYKKCFGFPLTNALSETESKHFGNAIYEQTGLVIGAKSIKNYSAYLLSTANTKAENPSIATLDTFARYVLSAPYTDELTRKEKDTHYPYWYKFKNTVTPENEKKPGQQYRKKNWIIWGSTVLAIIITALVILFFAAPKSPSTFVDNFQSLQDDSLAKNGWFIKSKDIRWWAHRGDEKNFLTLFTLRGDNWPDTINSPEIKNLLLRKLNADCFDVEIHMDNFFPRQNWQQTGILLMEDTTFDAKTVRLSIGYNDFFGGYAKPKEILIQGVSSEGGNDHKPEEIIHLPLFSILPGQEALVNNNLRKSALRIEKNNNHFRFLYSTSPIENFAFKEAFTKDLLIKPKYIGVFALQGFVSDTNYIPVHFNFFRLSSLTCEK